MKRSLRSWLWRVPLVEEVDEEIAFHIEMRTRELTERGMDPKAARDIVMARIGDVSRLKRTCVDLGKRREREMRITRLFNELRDDVKYALRQLRAAPGFTAVAAITLALGIGANSAMFALADATLLRPLPFPDPDRLVLLSELWQGRSGAKVNNLDFFDWRDRTHSFTAVAAVMRSQSSIIGADGTAEQIPAQTVTAQFFKVLGVTPIAGRTFVDADEGPAPDVVVISETLWRSRFGADPTLVGRSTRLAGRMFTVIGIVPADFQFDLPGMIAAGPSSVWTLLSRSSGSSPAERYPHFLQVIGRLKPGLTIEAARADMAAVSEALAREWPATNKGHRATADPLRDEVIGRELRLTAMLLFGVVGLVLLMCCANVANVLLARASARSREFAVRAALGAGWGRIVRQLLTESLVLAWLGAVAGAAIGAGILKAAPSVMPPNLLPATMKLGFDGRVLMFCAGAAFVVALLYGLAPAWHARGTAPSQAMTIDGRTMTGSNSRVRRLLAMSEVAIAVVLLCGAGLLLRTLLALEHVESGSRASNLLTMVVGAGGPGGDLSPASLMRNYDAYQREVSRVAGVRAVAWGSALPFDGRLYGQAFEIDGDPPRSPADRENAGYQIVSPSYLPLLGIPVRAGRGFSDTDTAESPQVCLVDEAFVRRFLRGKEPLHARIAINAMVMQPHAITRQIVGVVGDVKEQPDEPETEPHVYVPIAQNPWWTATLVVQPERGRAEALTSAVRTALARVNQDQAAAQIRTLDAIGAAATSKPRFRTVLIGTFALLALVLAMVGVFGVLAYWVQQRTREFGVRIALGATTRHVLGIVLGSAAPAIAIGAAIGLAAAAALSRAIASFLFGVPPIDPVTFGLVALVLAITATAAMLVPALRAARVDPVQAFRAE